MADLKVSRIVQTTLHEDGETSEVLRVEWRLGSKGGPFYDTFPLGTAVAEIKISLGARARELAELLGE